MEETTSEAVDIVLQLFGVFVVLSILFAPILGNHVISLFERMI